MDRIKLDAAEPCVAGCNGQWHKCATEVFCKNAIHPVVFASALQKLLIEGEGKVQEYFNYWSCQLCQDIYT